jgi:hypothetical protein
MTALKHPREATLEEGVAAFERAAIAPAVPGELCAWVEEIVRHALELEPVVQQRREKDHARMFEQMRRMDNELNSKIEMLERESAALPGRIGGCWLRRKRS